MAEYMNSDDLITPELEAFAGIGSVPPKIQAENVVNNETEQDSEEGIYDAPDFDIADNNDDIDDDTNEAIVKKEGGRTYTQSEVNDMITKRVNRERAVTERKTVQALRQQMDAQSEKFVSQADVKDLPKLVRPNQADYDNVGEYVDAKIDYEVAVRSQKQLQDNAVAAASRQAEARSRQAEARISQRLDEVMLVVRESPSFNQEAFDNLPITDAMALSILHNEVAPKIIQHLTLNPKEAIRISKLSPIAQTTEIGRLQERLSSFSNNKRVSAPEPISATNARGSPSNKSISTMLMADLMKTDWKELKYN